MGIRFYCPNGHKLNVKEFQAGRRGICPFCGAKIQIPTRSTRPPSRKSGDLPGESDEQADAVGGIELAEEPGGAGAEPSPTAGHSPAAPSDRPSIVAAVVSSKSAPRASSAPTTPAAGPSAQPVARHDSPAPETYQSPSESPATPSPSSLADSGPMPDVPQSPAPALADPIAESPEMIWYVRPPAGGQFGPAAGEVMRTWLAEGRVSADSLVWREGWRDWQEAGSVFPQLQPSSPMEFSDTAGAVSTTPVHSSPARHVHHPKGRRRVDGSKITMIGMLVIGVIVLIAVFLYVLFGS